MICTGYSTGHAKSYAPLQTGLGITKKTFPAPRIRSF